MELSKAKKWVVFLFAFVLAMVLSLSGLVYLIDPFFQFRVKDNSYFLSGWYVDSGLINNYDYDTLIIGSSMIQNFDMDLFRRRLHVEPLHIGLGGMTTGEFKVFLDLAYNSKKATKFYICIDLSTFAQTDNKSRFPEYLLKKDLISRLRYFLSYEVWFRYIPVDVAFCLFDHLGINLPIEYKVKKSIDKLEDWRYDYANVGKEAVIRNYSKGLFEVSEIDTNNLLDRMKRNIDEYLEFFSFEDGEYTFFFPPYSALFWCDAQNKGYYEVFLQAKRYFYEKLAGKRNIRIFDFQSANCTIDLENYKDTTHYLPIINDWMVDCFANNVFELTLENYDYLEKKIEWNVKYFRNANTSLFNKEK